MMALSVIAASSSVLGVSSCVNQEYDLNKGIDKTVNLNGQISAPIGNTGKIMIGDFLELNGEKQIFSFKGGFAEPVTTLSLRYDFSADGIYKFYSIELRSCE